MNAWAHRSRRLAAKVVRRTNAVFDQLRKPSESEVLLSRIQQSDASAELAGKVVVITGSSRGIGRVVAKAMASQGARIVVNGRDPARVESTVSAILDAGGIALAVVADVATPHGARQLLDQAEAAFGPVDILINNAGINVAQGKAAWDAEASDVIEVLRVNVAGPYFCAAEAIRRWLRNGTIGRVINVSSGAGDRAFPKLAPYGVSKSGLEGLTRYFATDAGRSGIVVTGLQLGSVKSEMTRNAFSWADYELLPDARTVLPAFEFAATSPADIVHGRTFAAPRLVADQAAESLLAGPMAVVADGIYKPIVAKGIELSRDPAAVTMFDRAENQFGPSPKVNEAILASIATMPVACYPDERYGGLRRALAAQHGLDPSCFAFANGSWTLIDELIRLFCKPGENVVSNWPGWFGFNVLCPRHSVDNKRVPLVLPGPDNRAHHNLDGILQAIGPQTRMIYLISPSNPEGVTLKNDQFGEFLDAVPANIPVVVDEAYAEYAEGDDIVRTAAWSARPDRIVIGLRTFSKFYGLAGMRLGYTFSRPDIARLINRQSLVFNVTALSETAAMAALADTAHQDFVRDTVRTERRKVEDFALGLGLGVVPSEAPFMLVQRPCPLDRYLEAFMDRKIVMPPYDFYDGSYVMFPVGRPDQNDTNLEILSGLVASGGKAR